MRSHLQKPPIELDIPDYEKADVKNRVEKVHDAIQHPVDESQNKANEEDERGEDDFVDDETGARDDEDRENNAGEVKDDQEVKDGKIKFGGLQNER